MSLPTLALMQWAIVSLSPTPQLNHEIDSSSTRNRGNHRHPAVCVCAGQSTSPSRSG
ncbi:hypothetical protein PCAR4_200106 [Paraburkholderia caribensis]|nr:hypothetical protein PCAR4_200106 [Paraburkholderia caribensis]